MKVFKFGGASIRDAGSIRNLHSIVKDHYKGLLLVVSAMGKGTNALEEILELKGKNQDYLHLVDIFLQFHTEICKNLFESNEYPVFQNLKALADQLQESLTAENTNEDKMYDQVISFGELFSSTVIDAYLNNNGIICKQLDSRKLVITDSTFKEGEICWNSTQKAINEQIDVDFSGCYLVQGFIGADQFGNTVTLGREGSDFTAAIFASCLDAESVTIWKDVPGILNADPELWERTTKYDKISYGEAAEMTYYGAKVIHPKTIRPLAVKKIPLMVKSFMNPSAKGTQINDVIHDRLDPAIIFKKDQCLISFQVRDFTFINESKLSIIFHLFEKFNIRINMMQSSAISFSVCVDSPDNKMKSLINNLSAEFEILYNDHLELITVKNYQPELIAKVKDDKNILLEQKTRKNYQILVAS